MTTPAAAAQVTLAGLDGLTQAELSERIDYHLRQATDPSCSIYAAAGVWMQVSALLNERANRSANRATSTMLKLTWVIGVLTFIVTIATIAALAK